jgi:hypothetical protein
MAENDFSKSESALALDEIVRRQRCQPAEYLIGDRVRVGIG